jgi:hypothetical protein
VEQFNATDRGDVMGSAQWQTAMGTAGGRGDLGIYPRWTVLWLYTMDAGLYTVMMGNANASGSLPMHFREALGGHHVELLPSQA